MGSFEIGLDEQSRQGRLVWCPPPQGYCAGYQVYSEPSSGRCWNSSWASQPISHQCWCPLLPSVGGTYPWPWPPAAHILDCLCKLALSSGNTLLTQRCENPSIYVSLEQLLPGPVDSGQMLLSCRRTSYRVAFMLPLWDFVLKSYLAGTRSSAILTSSGFFIVLFCFFLGVLSFTNMCLFQAVFLQEVPKQHYVSQDLCRTLGIQTLNKTQPVFQGAHATMSRKMHAQTIPGYMLQRGWRQWQGSSFI